MEKKKGKDPALLFYTADFLVGTMMMSMEQRGEYITLLCLEHQTGRLSPENIRKFTNDEAVLAKFAVDENGDYYSVRIEKEIAKRDTHREKQSGNAKKRWDKVDSGNATAIPNGENGNAKSMPNQCQTDTNTANVGSVLAMPVAMPLENENENGDEKDHLHFPHTLDNKKDLSVAVKECVVAESIGTPEGAGAGARASGPAPPKKSGPVRHKHGQYGWVRLTADEYNRLLEEWGNETLRKYIAIVDEYAQKTGNGKKYKDWNLVLRGAKRDGWGEGRKQEQNGSKPSTVNGRKLYGYEQRALDELRRAGADANG